MAAGALLLFVLLLVPSASAQLPREVGSQALHIVVLCQESLLEPNYAGFDEASCVLQDLSRDSVYAPGQTSVLSPSPHFVTLSTRPVAGSENATGWKTELTTVNVAMYGGDTIPFVVRAYATPTINAQDYNFELVADYLGPGGYNQTMVVPFNAQVNPYDFVLPSWIGQQSQKAGQDKVVRYELSLANTGVYPGLYGFNVITDDALKLSYPTTLYVPAGDTRSMNISVLTPHGKVYEFGRGIPLIVKINSLGVGGVTAPGAYSAAATLYLRGAYIPVYWIPLLLVGLASAAVVAKGGRERREMHRLEKGRPREVALSPRQAVLLAELRRADPDAYKEKRRALDSVYKERMQDYRAHRKEREEADRAEAKLAAAEFAAQKKARKEQRAQEKRDAKLAAAQARREDKELRKKEKVLAKARAKLEKRKAKEAKAQAKIDAKQAKLDAKAAAKAAAAQAKADRAAAKAAKKQKKQP